MSVVMWQNYSTKTNTCRFPGKRGSMTADKANPLFSWDDVEQLPDLRRLRLALCGFNPLPLQGRPSRRIETDPDRGAPVARIVPAPRRDGIPSDWNFSRLVANVVELEGERGLAGGMMDTLRRRLTEALPDYGEHLGCDGKAVGSHSTGRRDRRTGKTSDPDANWGRHETRGVDGNGKAWRKVKTWFGCGLHLIADSRHELPVAFRITEASASEQPVMSRLADELFESEPELARRCRDCSADRGHDGGPLKRMLWDRHQVRPLIDVCLRWREEKEMPDHDPSQPILRPLRTDRVDNILHSERGEVSCRRPRTGEARPMAFQGFEAERGTLKCRCPAAAGALSASTWRRPTAASSRRRPGVRRPGGAATGAAARWSGSTPASTAASASRSTSSAARRRCRPGSGWRWR